MAPLTLTAPAESVSHARHSIAPSTPDAIYILLRSREIAAEVRGYLSWALDIPEPAYDRLFKEWDVGAENIDAECERLRQMLSGDIQKRDLVWLLMDDTSALEHGFLAQSCVRSAIRRIVVSDQSSRAFRRCVKAQNIDPSGLYFHLRRTEEADHVSYLEKLWKIIGKPRS